MKNIAEDVYFDVVYSIDDSGFYCEVYTPKGVEITTTKVWAEKEQAIQEVKTQYPFAVFMNDF